MLFASELSTESKGPGIRGWGKVRMTFLDTTSNNPLTEFWLLYLQLRDLLAGFPRKYVHWEMNSTLNELEIEIPIWAFKVLVPLNQRGKGLVVLTAALDLNYQGKYGCC